MWQIALNDRRGRHSLAWQCTEGLTLLLTAAHPMVTALHLRKVHFVAVQCIPTGNNSECCGKTTCGGGQAVHLR